MDSKQSQETERLHKEEAACVLREKAERVFKELMELGCSQKPALSTRNRIQGPARFNDAAYEITILAAKPGEETAGKIQIAWQGTRRSEEIARHVHDVLSCYKFSGVSYNLESKELTVVLNNHTKAALEKLDQDLQPLRTAIPAPVVSNVEPHLDGRVKHTPPDEQNITFTP